VFPPCLMLPCHSPATRIRVPERRDSPMLDLEKVAADVAEEEKMPTPAILINAIATALVGSVVVLALCACRLWRHRQMKAFISELPHASPDGAYLVIAYEWATPLERSFRRTSSRMQSSRLPLESIASISELVVAVMEHGVEHVDAEMRAENADVRYMDHHGIERRVGAKTRFEDVVGARALHIVRRQKGLIDGSPFLARRGMYTESA